MSKNIRNKLKLNIKINNGKVICAKSPELCSNCQEECEKIELFYYPFSHKDLKYSWPHKI